MKNRKGGIEAVIVGSIVFAFIAGTVLLLFAGPWYGTYLQGMRGKGMLLKSESEKKILVEQARAELEAAKLRADAIEIMGAAAQKYPEYRHQEFIGAFADALKDGKIQQIIYVPTEANIPIIEARRQ